MSKIGLVRFSPVKAISSRWTGAATQDEIKEIARKTTSAVVLTGTRRQVGEQVRLSLHLFNANGTDALGHWKVDTSLSDGGKSLHAIDDLASSIYLLLEAKGRETSLADRSCYG